MSADDGQTTPSGNTPEASSTDPQTGDGGTTGPIGTTAEPPRWTAGQHSPFAGKSAEEILGIAEAQAQMLARPIQVQAQPQAPMMAMDINDDDYIDGRKFKQLAARWANNANYVDFGARQQAAGALLAAVEMRRSDDFKRWGAEIRAELAKLDPTNWTIDNLNIVVDIVKSRHVEELAQERAARLAKEAYPTIRSGSGGSGNGAPYRPPTLNDEGVPREWAQAARAAGITEQQVWEFCQQAGISEEQYYKDLMKYGKSGYIHG